jgi:hypothetical protein
LPATIREQTSKKPNPFIFGIADAAPRLPGDHRLRLRSRLVKYPLAIFSYYVQMNEKSCAVFDLTTWFGACGASFSLLSHSELS